MSCPRRAGRAAVLALAALFAGVAPVFGEDARPALDALPTERVVLETQAKGRHEYTAWRADTPDTRARGLMYVAALTDDQAMIFVYDEPQRVSMWMKNTYLSLDMLFVDARGCIVHIARAREAPVSGVDRIGHACRARRRDQGWCGRGARREDRRSDPASGSRVAG